MVLVLDTATLYSVCGLLYFKKVDDKPIRHHYWVLRSYPTPSVRHTPEWNPCIIYI